MASYRLVTMTAVGWQSEPGRHLGLAAAELAAAALIAGGHPRVAIRDDATDAVVADILSEGATPSWYDRDRDLRTCPTLVGR